MDDTRVEKAAAGISDNDGVRVSEAAIIEQLVGSAVVSAVPLRGGRNSKVVKVTTADGTRYVMKAYFGATMSGLDRLDVEVSALRFLGAAGVDSVPRVIRALPEHGVALFEFIDGEPVSPDAATPDDIDALVEFLAALKDLRGMPAAALLPSASEASFSIAGTVATLERRRARLEAIAGAGPEYDDVRRFLAREFDPAVADLTRAATREVAGIRYDEEIPASNRTLSPSDFGLHNVIRRTGGTLAFHDFEYFGWDDPAKLCSDVLLHPAAPLTERQRGRFLAGAKTLFGSIPGFPDRLAAVYPLFGLMWVMIMLNEFHQGDLARRQFAGEPDPASDVRIRQLALARAMLDRIVNDRDRQLLSS